MKRKFARRDFLKAATIGTVSMIATACGVDSTLITPAPTEVTVIATPTPGRAVSLPPLEFGNLESTAQQEFAMSQRAEDLLWATNEYKNYWVKFGLFGESAELQPLIVPDMYAPNDSEKMLLALIVENDPVYEDFAITIPWSQYEKYLETGDREAMLPPQNAKKLMANTDPFRMSRQVEVGSAPALAGIDEESVLMVSAGRFAYVSKNPDTHRNEVVGVLNEKSQWEKVEVNLSYFKVSEKGYIPVLNAGKWKEEHKGVNITPGDIMKGYAITGERPFPTTENGETRVVTGFWIDTFPGTREKTIMVEVDKQIKNVKELPFVYDTMIMDGAHVLDTQSFAAMENKWKVKFDRLLVVKMKINTVGGELELVMITDGDIALGTNGRRDFSKAISEIAGPNSIAPAVPLIKPPAEENSGDVVKAELAGNMARHNATELMSVGELMASAHLSDPAQFSTLQKALRETYLFLNIVPNKESLLNSYVHVQGK